MARLIIIAGPTASGKTAYAIELAQHYDAHILSCDSRQFYSELDIGVARPTQEQLNAAPHHFIACRSIQQPYNVYDYEHDAVALLDSLFEHHDIVIAVGGSGLYIDALVSGMAYLPDPAPGLRESLQEQFRSQGLAFMQQRLRQLDPNSYAVIDLNNPVRIQRALEVVITSGKPYSQWIAEHKKAQRPFDIEIKVLQPSLDILRQRINQRVDEMIANGLPAEAFPLWQQQTLTPLRTVGYREFYAYETPDEALRHLSEISDKIKMSTWHYAKKQITWCKKYLQ